MNVNFLNEFKSTKKLMKKSLYKDKDWVQEVLLKLNSLKNIWPEGLSHREIADSINETLFDVDVIYEFTYLDKEKLKKEPKI